MVYVCVCMCIFYVCIVIGQRLLRIASIHVNMFGRCGVGPIVECNRPTISHNSRRRTIFTECYSKYWTSKVILLLCAPNLNMRYGWTQRNRRKFDGKNPLTVVIERLFLYHVRSRIISFCSNLTTTVLLNRRVIGVEQPDSYKGWFCSCKQRFVCELVA